MFLSLSWAKNDKENSLDERKCETLDFKGILKVGDCSKDFRKKF